ncbi:serine/threonine-protein kinase [Streptomyces yaizuensis]|uniref:non-specific serine/threonine protein kinase n=1 Tax=Streptomyces yaizuensis TaxID=2989713 RepID=A0ABQ5P2H1_9ACTN|nr:serine/threonine-protein kinase [Streptomyces sp. YSPA8]GLF96729.1 serine/threonine protein kinase [Streptomyces sp. YSPA8]
MGEVFAGRYELVDPIGRGGVGAVWRAWDHRRRRYVAAKVLQQSDAHTLLRFVREQALRIDHPHVLAPASWAADDDKVLFTMDLVSGGSLAHVIGDYGPLPPRYVCALLDQLLSGLAAVHAEGVVHRDIKPANILMEATGTRRPHLRLSDFGISMRKGEPRLTETNYVVGTPGYFAPEQVEGAEPDFPADLFAVGLVALYLLEGQKPDTKALVDFFTAHGTPGAPQGIPEPLWQVLAGLIQPDPRSRFRTATGARKALAAALELLPETGPDDEPVEIFDQLGPLPPGFGADGPAQPPAPGLLGPAATGTDTGTRTTTPGVFAPAPPDPTGTPHTDVPAPPAPPAPGPHTPPPPPPGGTDPHAPPPTPAPSPSPTPVPGSFPVPPPPAQPPTPPPHPARPAAPPPLPFPPDHEPTPPPSPPAPGTRYPYPPEHPQQHALPVPYTAEYTAPFPVPLPRTPHPPRRPQGPPAKVVVPVLILALICFTIGFWALAEA